jgi:hypothetical protein
MSVPRNKAAMDALLAQLKTEVIDQGEKIDPDDEHDFESLILGWAIAKGLPVKQAKAFAAVAERLATG